MRGVPASLARSTQDSGCPNPWPPAYKPVPARKGAGGQRWGPGPGGPPRAAGAGRRILDGLAVHVAPTALGPKDPSASALTALVSAAGGRSVALRHAAVALVGADWKAAECRQAGLRALHRSGCALRFRWLCEAVEAGDADAVARELYATNH